MHPHARKRVVVAAIDTAVADPSARTHTHTHAHHVCIERLIVFALLFARLSFQSQPHGTARQAARGAPRIGPPLSLSLSPPLASLSSPPSLRTGVPPIHLFLARRQKKNPQTQTKHVWGNDAPPTGEKREEPSRNRAGDMLRLPLLRTSAAPLVLQATQGVCASRRGQRRATARTMMLVIHSKVNRRCFGGGGQPGGKRRKKKKRKKKKAEEGASELARGDERGRKLSTLKARGGSFGGQLNLRAQGFLKK